MCRRRKQPVQAEGPGNKKVRGTTWGSETLQRSFSSVWRAEGLVHDWYTDNQANKSGNCTNSGKSKRLHEEGSAALALGVRVTCALSRKTEHSGRPWDGETELSPHLPGRKPLENTRVQKALRSLEGNE